MCRWERREGGETGIAAVQCHEREHVWEWMGANPWAGQLLGALGGSGPARGKVKDPLLFLLEYQSDLQAGIFRLNGWQAPRTFAASVRGKAEPLVLADEETILPGLVVPESLKERCRHNHFSATAHWIEEMVLNGRLPNPVERTLLTTGALAALREPSCRSDPSYGRSLQHGTRLERGRRIETPYLAMAYRVS